MTTITVSPEVNATSETIYRAVTGDKQASGKTLGEAIDALTTELDAESRANLTIIARLASLPVETEWKYLAPFSSGWRKQLRFKGRRLRAATVWSNMLLNQMTVEEAAHDWDLTVEQVEEAIRYCEANRALLDAEAETERNLLLTAGVRLDTEAPVR